MGRPSKYLSKEDLRRAMKMTRSNRAAARYLHCSYNHYKKYAKTYIDQETGKSFLELHKNQSGKGIPKFLVSGTKKPPLIDLIEGRIPSTHFDPKKIKARLLFEGFIEEKCARCGFNEQRIQDLKVPLLLHHKDGDKVNWHLENLEMLCYNCSFLYAISPITEQQAEAMEDYVERQSPDIDWELDEHMKEHLKDLNLYEEEVNDGTQFIAKRDEE